MGEEAVEVTVEDGEVEVTVDQFLNSSAPPPMKIGVPLGTNKAADQSRDKVVGVCQTGSAGMSPNKVVEVCQTNSAGMSPSKVVEVCQTNSAGVSPNRVVEVCQISSAGMSPSKVVGVFQTGNAGMSRNKVVEVSPSKVVGPSPDSLVEMFLSKSVGRCQDSLVVKFLVRSATLFLASSVGMSRETNVGVSQGPVAEMSPSKSVARSVRISSGAKSVPEEYDLDCLQNTLHCQLDLFGRLSLSGTIYF